MKKLCCYLCAVLLIFSLTGCSESFFDPEKEPESSTRMNLNYTEKTLQVGENLKLTTNIVAKKDVEHKAVFETSDVDVVSVDETGLVIAKKEGDAEITVTTEDPLDDGKSVCRIKVVPVKKAHFSGYVPIADNGGQTYNVSVSFENCSAPYVKIIADCGGGQIVSENGTIDFGGEALQTFASGGVTVKFSSSAAKQVNSLRIICYDDNELIDVKEYNIFKY